MLGDGAEGIIFLFGDTVAQEISVFQFPEDAHEETRIRENVPILFRDISTYFVFEVVANGIFSWEEKENLLEPCSFFFFW